MVVTTTFKGTTADKLQPKSSASSLHLTQLESSQAPHPSQYTFRFTAKCRTLKQKGQKITKYNQKIDRDTKRLEYEEVRQGNASFLILQHHLYSAGTRGKITTISFSSLFSSYVSVTHSLKPGSPKEACLNVFWHHLGLDWLCFPWVPSEPAVWALEPLTLLLP